MDDAKTPVQMQGVLIKCGKYTGALNMRKCHCKLQDGYLAYRKEGDKEKTLDIIDFQSIRPLKDCSFEIVTHNSAHVFAANSVVERDRWVKALQELMGLTATRRSSTIASVQSRSYSEDNTTFLEARKDIPKQSNKFSLISTLSASVKSGKGTTANQSKISTSSITQSNDSDPSRSTVTSNTGECSVKRETGSAGTTPDVLTPDGNHMIYEFVTETENDQIPAYEEIQQRANSVGSSSSDSDSVADVATHNEIELYAYVSSDGVKKVLSSNKPNLCNEYSSVHDHRASEFLYSEVAQYQQDQPHKENESLATCGVPVQRPKLSVPVQHVPEVGIYELARDPYAGVQCASSGNVKPIYEECLPCMPGKKIHIYEEVDLPESSRPKCQLRSAPEVKERAPGASGFSGIKGNDLARDANRVNQAAVNDVSVSINNEVQVTSRKMSSVDLDDPLNFCDGAVKQMIDVSTVLCLDESESCIGREIPDLPNPMAPPPTQSAFDEMRVAIEKMGRNGEKKDLLSNAPPTEMNAVEDLKMFLQKIG